MPLILKIIFIFVYHWLSAINDGALALSYHSFFPSSFPHSYAPNIVILEFLDKLIFRSLFIKYFFSGCFLCLIKYTSGNLFKKTSEMCTKDLYTRMFITVHQ